MKFILAVCFFLLIPGFAAANSQVFEEATSATPEIRTYPLEAPDNSGGTHRFVLSVLGVPQQDGFLPLLAAALKLAPDGTSTWLALWNLSDHPPGFGQRFKALFGLPGSARKAKGSVPLVDGLPEPNLSVKSLRDGAWEKVSWRIADTASAYLSYVSPTRFFLKNYTRRGADRTESQFHQTYTLLRLYQDVSGSAPAPEHLTESQILSLKYYLLVNQRVTGLFVPVESMNEIVQRFESELRAKMGSTASHLRTDADLHGLGVKELDFGLPGRPPICKGALLYVRKKSLPADLPPWTRRNVLGLDYNPLQREEVLRLMDRHPDEEIPVAFYVLVSDFNLKPVLVADFFSNNGGVKRESDRVWRITLNQVVDLSSIPLLYRVLGRVTGYALNKKDFARFSPRSTAAGIEPARLFARLDWSLDPDTSALLVKALDKRIANPLADSVESQDEAARARFNALLSPENPLPLFLRRLFEDEVRSTLRLGNRALFSEDLAQYGDELTYRQALRVIRNFNASRHLPSKSWSAVLEAWSIVSSRGLSQNSRESRLFLDRLATLAPIAPVEHRAAINGIVAPLLATHRQPAVDASVD